MYSLNPALLTPRVRALLNGHDFSNTTIEDTFAEYLARRTNHLSFSEMLSDYAGEIIDDLHSIEKAAENE